MAFVSITTKQNRELYLDKVVDVHGKSAGEVVVLDGGGQVLGQAEVELGEVVARGQDRAPGRVPRADDERLLPEVGLPRGGGQALLGLQHRHRALAHDHQLHEADLHVVADVHVHGAGDLLAGPVLVEGGLVHLDVEEGDGSLLPLQHRALEVAGVVRPRGLLAGVGGVQSPARRGVPVADHVSDVCVVVVVVVVGHGAGGAVANDVGVGVPHAGVHAEDLSDGGAWPPGRVGVVEDVAETGAFGGGGELVPPARAGQHCSGPGSA